MSTQNTLALMSEADYLAGEKHRQIRHEYVAGYVFAMSGASRAHNIIAGNLFAWLHAKTANTSCQVYMSDFKVRIAHRQTYYYPDILVGCQPDDDDDFYLEKPCLIVEVLSPSTERTDRLEKLMAYQSIPSLKAYVLVSQEKYQIEVYTPIDNQQWKREIYVDLNENIFLPCVDDGIIMHAVYDDIALNTPSTE